MTTLERPMSEAAFQRLVIETATAFGWQHYHPHDSRRSRAGWPDLALWHPRRRRFLLAELKTQTGTASPGQYATIISLREAGVDARIWRPSDWPEIQQVLGR